MLIGEHASNSRVYLDPQAFATCLKPSQPPQPTTGPALMTEKFETYSSILKKKPNDVRADGDRKQQDCTRATKVRVREGRDTLPSLCALKRAGVTSTAADEVSSLGIIPTVLILRYWWYFTSRLRCGDYSALSHPTGSVRRRLGRGRVSLANWNPLRARQNQSPALSIAKTPSDATGRMWKGTVGI